MCLISAMPCTISTKTVVLLYHRRLLFPEFAPAIYLQTLPIKSEFLPLSFCGSANSLCLGSPGIARMYLRVSLDHLAFYLYFHQVALLVPIFTSWRGTAILIYPRMATVMVNSPVKATVCSFLFSYLFPFRFLY